MTDQTQATPDYETIDYEIEQGMRADQTQATPLTPDWQEEARRYAENADYWRSAYNALRAATPDPAEPVYTEAERQDAYAKGWADARAVIADPPS